MNRNTLRIQLGLLLVLILFSCRQKVEVKIPEQQQKVTYTPSMVIHKPKEDTTTITNEVEEYADYYIIIADTGSNYAKLNKKMFQLKDIMSLEIDTLGRYYNKKKNLIALPDNADDELYAGDYFSRRNPSESLSLEYLDAYKHGAKKKQIALVSGIYEDQTSADSALLILKKTMSKAFKLKSHLYIGCMH